MIYLIGINHAMQYKNDKQHPEFLEFVKKTVREHNIEIIAEEWNQDADKLNGIEKSSLAELADKLQLPLLQTEAPVAIQEKVGIISINKIISLAKRGVHKLKSIEDLHRREEIKNQLKRKNTGPRENYWLSKLIPHSKKSVLFVCGNDHINS